MNDAERKREPLGRTLRQREADLWGKRAYLHTVHCMALDACINTCTLTHVYTNVYSLHGLHSFIKNSSKHAESIR